MDENILSESMYRTLSIARCLLDNTFELDNAIRKSEYYVEGSDLFEQYLSGSRAERTYIPPQILHQDDADKFQSDQDQMYIWKIFNCGVQHKADGLLNLLLLENFENPKNSVYEDCYRIQKQRLRSLPDLFYEDTPVRKYRLESKVNHGIVLLTDETNCFPGYLRLVCSPQFFYVNKLVKERYFRTDFLSINKVIAETNVTFVNNVPYLSSVKHIEKFNLYFRDYFDRYSNKKRFPQKSSKFPWHGPAVIVGIEEYQPYNTNNNISEDVPNYSKKMFIEGIDFVPAFRSPYWPKSSLKMMRRKTNSRLPSKELKSAIFLKGCLIVGTSHKESNHPDIEWRYSFSECETMLCLSWNKTQTYCYVMLKLLKQKYFKDIGMCSYYFKTCVFWAVEIFEAESWISSNLITLIERTFQMLIDFLTNGNLPNYFIEENNMIKHFKKEELVLIIKNLTSIKNNLGRLIWNSFHIEIRNEASLIMKDDYYAGKMKLMKGRFEAFQVMFFNEYWTKQRSAYMYRYNSCHGNQLQFLIIKHLENYERYLRESICSPSNVQVKKYVSLVTASFCHTALCSYLISKNLKYYNKALVLFKSDIEFDNLLGRVQLALFYSVTNDHRSALAVLDKIPCDILKLDCKQFHTVTKTNVDIQLMPVEMRLYNMACLENTIDNHLWTFDLRLFSKYLKATLLIRLNYFAEGWKLILQVEEFLKEMELKVDPIFCRFSSYLVQLCRNLLYASIFLYASNHTK